jgi:hypothetical protein
MEDDLTFLKMEDDLNFLNKMEDDLNFLQNGKQPKLSGKWKMALILR